jgi:hypothetical protein
MKIELKNLEVNLKFSEETTMFQADIVVDGKKVAYAQNDGRGGETYYHIYARPESEYKRNLKIVEQAEAYCETLPDDTLTYDHNGEIRTMELKRSLRYVVDELVEKSIQDKEKKKFQKKLQKDMEKYICYTQHPETLESYGVVGAKKKDQFSLQQIANNPRIKEAVREHVRGLKLKGYIILNQNCPEVL